ncbi:cell division protein ZapA [Abyssisolibacter fermentans]|uniref:cell division protein ZapA n=1 Tax=Abyssisolibacter fermentans TaxID=1766203 RepID=UPI00082D9DDA|nr:cell division protein ZapA [Abyssisolibacter fermentans]
MTEKNKVIVRINGQDYTVIGNEPEEYIQLIAEYVDQTMRDIISQNSKLGQSMAATLTAFTIADKLHKIDEELNNLKVEVKEPLDELKSTKQKLEYYSKEFTRLTEENKNYSESNKLLKHENNKYEKKCKHQEESLKLKEDELEKCHQIISQLQNKLFENHVEMLQTKKELEELKKLYDNSLK